MAELDKVREENATWAGTKFVLTMNQETKADNMIMHGIICSENIYFTKQFSPYSLCTPLGPSLEFADKDSPSRVTDGISKFRWKVKDGTMMPFISPQPVEPLKLMDVISCSCHVDGKACTWSKRTVSVMSTVYHVQNTVFVKVRVNVVIHTLVMMKMGDEYDGDNDEEIYENYESDDN